MGYDFTLLGVPGDVAVLRDRVLTKPDRDTVREYLAAVEPYSFHLNLAGMGYCRERMARLAMLAEGTADPFPPAPMWDQSTYRTEEEHRRANPTVWEAFDAAESVASRQRAAGRGIARFKLESNGPWVVLADEVRDALEAFDHRSATGASDREVDEVWYAWIAWLRRAKLGFEVN